MRFANEGKPISIQRERELFKIIRNNPDSKMAQKARGEIVLSNLGFILTEAKANAVVGTCAEFDDLVNQGVEGLLYAFGKFSTKRGVRFLSYASWWVQHYMQRAVHAQGRTVAIPTHRIASLSAIHKAMSILAREGIESTPATIAKQAKLPIGAVITTLRMEEDGYFEWIRNLGVKSIVDEESIKTENDYISSYDLKQAIKKLNELEQKIIYQRIIKEETLRGIGTKLGISKETVRQIEKSALKKLKEYLTDF